MEYSREGVVEIELDFMKHCIKEQRVQKGRKKEKQ